MRRLLAIALIALAAVIGVTALGSPQASGGGTGPAAEFGGSQAVYDRIARESDCADLQAEFDQAGDNNDAAEPGTDAHRWSLGYMKAADERMLTIGCYSP